jgi:hypothetical protein
MGKLRNPWELMQSQHTDMNFSLRNISHDSAGDTPPVQQKELELLGTPNVEPNHVCCNVLLQAFARATPPQWVKVSWMHSASIATLTDAKCMACWGRRADGQTHGQAIHAHSGCAGMSV